jgi:eukaryotic-like serine/threonine-protein kinase
MGEVYRATNVSLGRKVAIKLLSAEFGPNEDDVLRFLREARAAAAVRHSNVVDVLDVARDDDGTPFIVQELLAGEDLEHYLKARGGSRLSFDEALEIMIPVADAVATAHASDVVHRDLKPANIFLSRERNAITPKVLDFGACLFPTIGERSAKELRMLIGTPHYMAPEQIVSKADVDARSDVWALGVILYEMLVGETPFEADTTNAVLHLVKTRDVPPLRDAVPNAPKELEALIAECTRRERLARFANAGVLYERMKAVRQQMRGIRDSSKMETLTELPAQRPDAPAAEPPKAANRPPPPPPAAGRPAPAPAPAPAAVAAAPAPPPAPLPATPGRPKQRLLTLSSPGSEPPPSSSLSDFDLEIPLPTSERDRPPPASAERPTAARAAPPVDDDPFREDDAAPATPIALGARPSSWPPAPPDPTPRPARPMAVSSMPPVLDPGRAAAKISVPPSPPVPREAPLELATAVALPRPEPVALGRPPTPAQASPVALAAKPARPPAARAKDFSSKSGRSPSAAGSGGSGGWSIATTVKFVVAIAVPAVAAFIAVLAVPALGTPIGHALHGDSTFASGFLAVLSLVCAAALCARTMLNEERERLDWVAAGGSVLFGIVMIIVTSSASEAAELGVPNSMASLSTIVAPIAPLALAISALQRARSAWTDPYSRGEAARFAALASVMLFLTLVLSPVGAVRTPTRSGAPRTSVG